MSTTVKNTLLFGCMMLCMSLASCQCSNKPSVAPVEDGQAAAAAPTSRAIPLVLGAA